MQGSECRRYIRHGYVIALGFAVMCIATSSCAKADTPTAARWSADFGESIGVNTHFTWLDTYYATHFQEVKARLVDLGVRHIRDGATEAHGEVAQADRFRDLGQAGIRADFIFSAGASRRFVQAFPQRVAPVFESYEAPNEFNVHGGADWAIVLRRWLSLFQDDIRENTATKAFPILGPSLVTGAPEPFAALGPDEQAFDFGNLHIYFDAFNPGTAGWGDRGPPPCQQFSYGSIGYMTCLERQVSGAKPLMVTETGWSSDPACAHGLPADLQAKYIARMLLLQFERGTRRTYIYQLLDAGSDDGRCHGLLTADGREKPSFRELRTLLRLTADRHALGNAGALAFRLDGDTDQVRTMLLRRANGFFRLILWVEAPGYDPNAAGGGARIVVRQREVILNLMQGHIRAAWRIDDSGELGTGNFGILLDGPVRSYALMVSDNLTVLDISSRTK